MKGRLPGALLQRLAARLCTAEACERTLFPILADLQFEWQQAPGAARRLSVRLRGMGAFARAFLPALMTGAAHHLRRNAWGRSLEDQTATKRLLTRMVLATLALSLLLVLDQAPPLVRFGMVDAVLLLVPSIVSIALPAGCLLGVAWAVGSWEGRPRWRTLLGLAALAGLVTFAVSGWLTPQANQMFRERLVSRMVAGGRTPLRGDRERTFGELSGRAAALRRAGETAEANRAAIEWHKKPALAAYCMALAVAGMALAGLVRRRPLRMVLALLVLGAQFSWLRLAEQAAAAGQMAPALAMWGGVALLALGALMAVLQSREARTESG